MGRSSLRALAAGLSAVSLLELVGSLLGEVLPSPHQVYLAFLVSLPKSRSFPRTCAPPSVAVDRRLCERVPVKVLVLLQLHWEFRRLVACCPSLLPGHLRRGPVSRGVFANPLALVSPTCYGVWPQATPPAPDTSTPQAQRVPSANSRPAGTTHPRRKQAGTDDLSQNGYALSLSLSLSLSLLY